MRSSSYWVSGLAALVACGRSEGDDAPPVEAYACLHIAEGTILDVADSREEADTIAVGRDPYRVNVMPGVAGYVRFETDAPSDLVLLLDFAGAVPAVWSGEDRVEITPGEPNPNCDVDLLEVDYLSVPAGEHWLEIGPVYQGNVWLMLAPAGG
ncbi:MAG: hypothetical protein ABMA64_00065 [Myxococcota bacterium]